MIFWIFLKLWCIKRCSLLGIFFHQLEMLVKLLVLGGTWLLCFLWLLVFGIQKVACWMLMSTCSIDNGFNVWHLWVDNNAKSITNFKVSHLRVISSQHGKDFRNSITISASYMQIYRCSSVVLFWRLLSTFWWVLDVCRNLIPSFTGGIFDSMLLAVLIAEYPSPFLYKLSKNSVPSLIDALEMFSA